MTEPKDLLLLVEQLRRSNRRWKALALAACAVVILAVLFGVAGVERQRRQAEEARRAADAVLVRDYAKRVDTQQATNPPPPAR